MCYTLALSAGTKPTGLVHTLYVNGQDMANYSALPCGMGFRAITDKKFRTVDGGIRQSKAMIAASIGMSVVMMLGVTVVVVMMVTTVLVCVLLCS